MHNMMAGICFRNYRHVCESNVVLLLWFLDDAIVELLWEK